MEFETPDQKQFERELEEQIRRDQQEVVDLNVRDILGKLVEEFSPEKRLWAQCSSQGEKEMRYLVKHGYALELGEGGTGRYYDLSVKGLKLLLQIVLNKGEK